MPGGCVQRRKLGFQANELLIGSQRLFRGQLHVARKLREPGANTALGEFGLVRAALLIAQSVARSLSLGGQRLAGQFGVGIGLLLRGEFGIELIKAILSIHKRCTQFLLLACDFLDILREAS